MLTADELGSIRQLLLSERLTVKGHEMPMVAQLIHRVETEEQVLRRDELRKQMISERIRPVPGSQPAPTIPPGAPVPGDLGSAEPE